MSRTDKEPGKNPVKRPTERPIKRRFILASLALTSVVLTLAAAAPAMAMNCMMAASPRLVFGEYDPKSSALNNSKTLHRCGVIHKNR